MCRSSFGSFTRAVLPPLLAAIALAAPAAPAVAQTAAPSEAPSEGWTGYVAGVISPVGLHEFDSGRSVGGSAALLRGTGTALEYGVEALYEQSGPITGADVRTYCTRFDGGCQAPCTPGTAGCIEERVSAYQMSNKAHLLGIVRLRATQGALRPYAETGLGAYLFGEHQVASSSTTGGVPDPYEFHYDERRTDAGLVLAMGVGVEVPVAARLALLAGARLQGHLGEGPEVFHPTFSAGVRLR